MWGGTHLPSYLCLPSQPSPVSLLPGSVPKQGGPGSPGALPILFQWSCCGARGPNDWNLNIYFNCTDLNPSRERCGVPFSCCVRDPAVSGAGEGGGGHCHAQVQSWKISPEGSPGPMLVAMYVRRRSFYMGHPTRLRSLCPWAALRPIGVGSLPFQENLSF